MTPNPHHTATTMTKNPPNIQAQTNQKTPTNPTINPLKNNQTNPHQPPPPSITHPHHHGNPPPSRTTNIEKPTTKSITIPMLILPLQTTPETHEHTVAFATTSHLCHHIKPLIQGKIERKKKRKEKKGKRGTREGEGLNQRIRIEKEEKEKRERRDESDQ